jgi:hypothetical protein
MGYTAQMASDAVSRSDGGVLAVNMFMMSWMNRTARSGFKATSRPPLLTISRLDDALGWLCVSPNPGLLET